MLEAKRYSSELSAKRWDLANRLQTTAIVKDGPSGYILCEGVNHRVEPSILIPAAEIVCGTFLKSLPEELHPQIVIGVPNRGKEFATAIALTADIPIGVTERIVQNGIDSTKSTVEYDGQNDIVSIRGIESFTKHGMLATHTIRGLKPGSIVLIADDFMAYGKVALKYLDELQKLEITPIFVTLVAKDFQTIDPPQTGYRQLKSNGVPAFAVVRFTGIEGGTGGRVIATAEDIKQEEISVPAMVY